MSARQEPPDPENSRLRRVVEDVAGVERAEIHGDAIGRPLVRVHLDGSRPEDAVLDGVRGAVSTWRRPGPEAPSATAPRPRRGGLGKGLDVLLAESHHRVQPPEPDPPIPDPSDERLARVDVVRTEHGVSVQAADTDGTVAVVFAIDGDLERSVAAAIATLLDLETPHVVGIDTRRLGGHPVVTVAVETPDGVWSVGSAPSGPDHLFAVGRAVWAALRA